jgi:hypothetical protein
MVASLARPSGNITGLSSQGTDLNQIENVAYLLAVPDLPRVAIRDETYCFCKSP